MSLSKFTRHSTLSTRAVIALATVCAMALPMAGGGLAQSHDHGHGHAHGHGHGGGTPAAVADTIVTQGDLTLIGPWARASMGMARAGAAFLTIENTGSDDRIIAATADISDRVELHTHIMDNGVMRMREVEGGIEVLGGETTTLAPGGLHVMFLGLEGPLEEGASFPVTLTFEQAGDVTLEVQVLAPGAGAMEGRGHSHSN